MPSRALLKEDSFLVLEIAHMSKFFGEGIVSASFPIISQYWWKCLTKLKKNLAI